MYDDPYSSEVQNLLKMTNLRINFTKLHTLGDDLLDNRNEILVRRMFCGWRFCVRGACENEMIDDCRKNITTRSARWWCEGHVRVTDTRRDACHRTKRTTRPTWFTASASVLTTRRVWTVRRARTFTTIYRGNRPSADRRTRVDVSAAGPTTAAFLFFFFSNFLFVIKTLLLSIKYIKSFHFERPQAATATITPRVVTMTPPCSNWPEGRAVVCATGVWTTRWDGTANSANSTSTKIPRSRSPTVMSAYVRGFLFKITFYNNIVMVKNCSRDVQIVW